MTSACFTDLVDILSAAAHRCSGRLIFHFMDFARRMQRTRIVRGRTSSTRAPETGLREFLGHRFLLFSATRQGHHDVGSPDAGGKLSSLQIRTSCRVHSGP